MKINWFSKKTVFFYDGYPRSGNTFLQMLIKNVYDKIDVVHHFHSIGAIKVALAKGVPTFIIYRDPKNAITSNYLKEYSFMSKNVNTKNTDKKLLNYFLENYVKYYQYVLQAKNCYLISFEKLIVEPATIAISINQKLPSKHRKEIQSIKQIILKVKDIEFGAKDKLGSSRPNEEKEKLKQSLAKQLSEMDRFEIAENHYKKLKTAHNNV